MKKYKKLLPLAGICIVIAVILALRFSMSYLIDVDVKNNVITIGNVSLKIDEGEYVDQETVAAGQSLPKAPRLINDGINDEYVFLTVAVPKKNVTLLYEEDTVINGETYREGTPIISNLTQTGYTSNEDQIFRMVADGVEAGAQPDVVSGNEPPKIAFAFNSGDDSNDHEGWIHLDTKTDQTIDGNKYDIYYFGYNKRLSAVKEGEKKQTITLFDHIQLKSFVDEELVNSANGTKEDTGATVLVKAYGIQADKLDLDLPQGENLLNVGQLREVFNIVVRKQVMP